MTAASAVPAVAPVGVAPRDAVGVADRLRTDVTARVRALVEGGAAAGAADDLPDIYVGCTAALAVARCPAQYRADGEDGWGFPGWSAPLAAAAVGRAALARHLALDDVALPAPLEVVRSWMRDAAKAPTTAVAEWIAQLVRSGDRTTVAATAATATRWVAGFLRLHSWPLPDRLGIVADDADGARTRRWQKAWRPLGRGTPVRVASSPDAVAGKVTASGQFDLVLHRPSSPLDEVLAERAAFEAAAGALTAGIVAAGVVVTSGDTGERVRFPVDDRRLTRGADLVAGVVHHRLVATQPTPDPFADATPGPACRHCPHRDDCTGGQAWLARSLAH